MHPTFQRLAERGCDFVMDRFAYAPSRARHEPLVIAHRGAWNSTSRPENTLAAFAEAAHLGVFGIELDVRFTRDQVPVVLHDPDLQRLFRLPHVVSELKFAEVRALAPTLPALDEVLGLRGVHFMIEIKTALDSRQIAILRERLNGLEAVKDYHFLVLDESLVRRDFASETWILVGDLRLRPLVEISLARGFGGVAGHYLTMTDRLIERLHRGGQIAGVGFVPTRNVFHREWSRDVDWVFTNTAADVVG